MYKDYKPLRNYMRQFGAVAALGFVWKYATHLAHRGPLPVVLPTGPDGRPLDFKRLVFPWDLEILAREIVLNAGENGTRSLGHWPDMAKAINTIRDLENETYRQYGAADTVLRELHRIAHRQFPWQRPPNLGTFLRNWKIWSAPALAAIVERETGLTVRQHTELCLAVAGNFTKTIGMVTTSDYGILGVGRDASTAFFDRISTSLRELRDRTLEQQNYDGEWAYTFNPLRDRPLIRFEAGHPERVMSPLPIFVQHRMSDGLYYDLRGATGFSDAFGPAFQAYVGEVLVASLTGPDIKILPETEYWVGKKRKDGVDWIASDGTATLFIECKTKRLRQSAKFSATSEELDEELKLLASFIVQTYKNIGDATAGLTAWRHDGSPIHPLIVTLENWYIFTPDVAGPLERHVRAGLVAVGMEENLVDRMPYTVGSIEELETGLRIMHQTGIQRFMAEKTDPEHRTWAMSGFAPSAFAAEATAAREYMFVDEWEAFQADLEGRHQKMKQGSVDAHVER